MSQRSKHIPGADAIERPRIEELVAFEGDGLVDEEGYEGVMIDGVQLRSQNAARVSIAASRLRAVSLAESSLPGFELLDAALDDCDLANTSLDDGSLERAELTGCRLVGMKAPESRLRE